MKKPRKLVTRFCAIFFAVQSGCATTSSSSQPTEQVDISKLGTVALANVHFAPTTSIQATDLPVSTSSTGSIAAGTVKGVGKGAVFCGGALSSGTSPVDGIVLAILCLPVGMVIGGIVGAVTSAVEASDTTAAEASDTTAALNQAKEAEGRFAAGLSALNVQLALREHVVQYAAKRALPPFVVLENQGPSAPDKLPAYYSPPDKPVDTVLEVGITEIFAVTTKSSDFTYYFRVTGRGRLLRIRGSTERVGDSMVLDSFTRTYYTYSYTLNEWLADDGKLLASELARGYQDLAEAFVNKW